MVTCCPSNILTSTKGFHLLLTCNNALNNNDGNYLIYTVMSIHLEIYYFTSYIHILVVPDCRAIIIIAQFNYHRVYATPCD